MALNPQKQTFEPTIRNKSKPQKVEIRVFIERRRSDGTYPEEIMEEIELQGPFTIRYNGHKRFESNIYHSDPSTIFNLLLG